MTILLSFGVFAAVHVIIWVWRLPEGPAGLSGERCLIWSKRTQCIGGVRELVDVFVDALRDLTLRFIRQ